MKTKLNHFLFAVPFGLALFAAACAPEEEEVLSSDNMNGTLKGTSWVAGPAAARRDADRVIVVRVFENSASGEDCSIPNNTGRRIEIALPTMTTGSFNATDNPGYRVEAWDGLAGQSDPQGRIEIDQASKIKGHKVIGRARFGSALNGDVVEGRFSASVCEELP